MNFRNHYLCKQAIIILWVCFLPFCVGAQGFTNVSSTAGVNFVHDGDMIQDTKIGSGAAWFDYNKDGHLDLYVTMRAGSNKLFKNNGNGTFTDVATVLNVADPDGDGSGVSVADMNNDGWDDLFLCNHGGNKLFKNNGGSSFTDITNTAFTDPLICGDFRSPSATWGDYDGDGNLEIYITQHTSQINNDTSSRDYLYYNNGDETFTDVSELLDTMHLLGWGFIGGWTDYDKDNDLDIIVVNDCFPAPLPYYPTKIFQNQGGTNPLTWNFEEVSVSAGMDDCRNGMGIAVGDINRDGWMDIFYTNIGACVLFENDEGSFVNVSAGAGIDGQAAHLYSWGPSFLDYDLDGWQDIMVPLGSLLPLAIPDPHPNMLFRNNGDGTFTDQAPALGIDDDRRSRNAIYADYDNDGDLDIFVLNYGENCTLLRNDNNNGYHWLKIKLNGTDSNKNGIGTKIKITTPDGVSQYYETRSGSNLGGGDSPYAHFGLNTNTVITEIELTWLSGQVQTFTNLAANAMYTFTEPAGPLPVELISFHALQEKQTVKLEWHTASEINNQHFIIQRSKDGFSFEDLGKVAGKGTTAITASYSFFDQSPLPNTNYYRLKQVDLDGKFEYSNIETVSFETEGAIAVFPNPVKQDLLNISFDNPVGHFTLEVFDAFGKLVWQQQGEEAGSISRNISTKEWNNGIHFIRFSGAVVQETVKVMVMK